MREEGRREGEREKGERRKGRREGEREKGERRKGRREGEREKGGRRKGGKERGGRGEECRKRRNWDGGERIYIISFGLGASWW